VLRFRGSNHIAASLNLVLRSALARVSKDGHKRDRARGHPSRRRTASRLQPTCVLDVPISGKPEIGAPSQDEVCGFKLHPLDPIGFMESIY
jgi:hypothetical protein